MSKKIIKSILITITIMLSMLILQTKVVEAKDITGLGNQVRCSAWTYESDNDIVDGKPGNNTFCVYQKEDLKPNSLYDVIYYVHIDGLTASIYKGNKGQFLAKHTNPENGIMAWILAQADEGGLPYKHQYSRKQKAIYGFFSRWNSVNVLGIKNRGNGYTNLDWINEGTKYAGEYQSGATAKITNNTENKKVSIDNVTVNGKDMIKIGPFKVTITGEIEEFNVLNQNNQKIATLCGKYNGTTLITTNNPSRAWIGNNNFYILVPADGSVSKINDIQIKVVAQKQNIKADIWTLSRNNGNDNQNLITTNAWVDVEKDYGNLSLGTYELLGKLKAVKVDKLNNEIKLSGVKFIFENVNSGKYVKQTNGKIEYVSEKSQATEFVTDKDGKIEIDKLIIGTYKAYETENSNYGYLPKDGTELPVKVKEVETLLENEQKWIKLSGYVWNDMPLQHKGNEESKRNDLYQEGEADKDEKRGDKRMPGVTVRLKNKKTNEIVIINGEKAEKKTDKNGEYQFVDVLIKELENYYIEFEYDGLVYKNVEPHLNKDNGSKSKENETVRANFNDSFSYIEDNGNQADNIGQARNSKGEVSHNDLYYNKGTGDKKYQSLLDHSKSVYNITANTNEAGYSIKDQYKAGMEEIKNINLGLQDREQPDLSLGNDLVNAIVSVNGYSHTYPYGYNYNGNGKFNVGVAFGMSPKGNTYGLTIYRPDVQTDFKNPDNKLKVYVTYKIQVINQATTLKSRVNRIADYYDTNFDLIEVGTGLDEKGAITGKLENYIEEYNDKYNKLTINTSDTNMINGVNDRENTLNIYIRFSVNSNSIERLFLNEAPMKNHAEIESYSTFDTNGKIYAGIDKNSAPGNIIPGEESTHENDDYMTPSFVLKEADARSMSGSVFEDIKGLNSENSALGDGIYNNTEQGIAGIEVKITTSETGNDTNKFTATTVTDQNGNYSFVGPYKDEVEGRFTNFIPGKYTIEFTWGGKTYTKSNGETTTYTVQNYKGTTQPKAEWNRKNTNLNWYKEYIDQRYTDAIDNYYTREDIDDTLKTIVYENATNLDMSKTMTATTALMELGIEINSTNTMEDKFEYKISNIDYGIIKRPSQDIQLDKRVSTVKLTLANGQVLIDATIAEDHTITGEKRNLKYIVNPEPGQIHIELDNELMQGSTLEVGYEFKATNIGEEDYQYDKYTDYYNFGISGTEDKLVTITPVAIIDYLDRDWGYNETINTQWRELTQEDIKTKTLEGTSYKMFAPEVYGNDSDIANRRILYTNALNEEELKPATATRTADSATTNLLVSKLLTTSDDIDLENQTEVIEITKTGGGNPESTPGNFVPGNTPEETDESESEKIIVTPPTGADNMTYVIYTAIGVLALAILGTGIVVIKKKILK